MKSWLSNALLSDSTANDTLSSPLGTNPPCSIPASIAKSSPARSAPVWPPLTIFRSTKASTLRLYGLQPCWSFVCVTSEMGLEGETAGNFWRVTPLHNRGIVGCCKDKKRLCQKVWPVLPRPPPGPKGATNEYSFGARTVNGRASPARPRHHFVPSALHSGARYQT